MAASTESLFRGVTDDLPSRVDVGAQIAPERFAIERERIWRRAWLAIGHTQDLPQKGSYFVYDIPTFNLSLLVIRGQDGEVRVFHNICRHRGNKLVRDGSGCRTHLTCNFHGWGFTADGKLRVITDEAEFEGCDKEKLGLIPVNHVNGCPNPPLHGDKSKAARWERTLRFPDDVGFNRLGREVPTFTEHPQ